MYEKIKRDENSWKHLKIVENGLKLNKTKENGGKHFKLIGMKMV